MKKILPRRRWLGGGLLAWMLAGFALSSSAQQPQDNLLTGDHPGVQDPSIAREGSTYYGFVIGKTKIRGQLTVPLVTRERPVIAESLKPDLFLAWQALERRSLFTREAITISLLLGIFVAVV